MFDENGTGAIWVISLPDMVSATDRFPVTRQWEIDLSNPQTTEPLRQSYTWE